MRLVPNSGHRFLENVLCQAAIPHKAHAYSKKDRHGFVVKGSKSLVVTRGDGFKQAT